MTFITKISAGGPRTFPIQLALTGFPSTELIGRGFSEGCPCYDLSLLEMLGFAMATRR
jgi:hypothetical protein